MHWFYYPALALGAAIIVAGGKVKHTGSTARFNFAAGVLIEVIGLTICALVPVASLTRLPDSDPRWTIAGGLIWLIIILTTAWAAKSLTSYYPDRPPRF